jgi:hypothetical protein
METADINAVDDFNLLIAPHNNKKDIDNNSVGEELGNIKCKNVIVDKIDNLKGHKLTRIKGSKNKITNGDLLANSNNNLKILNRQIKIFKMCIGHFEKKVKFFKVELSNIIIAKENTEKLIDYMKSSSKINKDKHYIDEKHIVKLYIEHCLKQPKEKITLNLIAEKSKVVLILLQKHFKNINNLAIIAKKKILADLVGEKTIISLKKYKKINGRYPPRPELIKNYISRRTLQKINTVLKTKHIMKNIYEYIDRCKVKHKLFNIEETVEDCVE